MTKYMTPQALRRRWADNLEVALVDVREEGPYADSHPLFAVSVPLSELEARLPALVPRASAPLAIYDGGEGYAEAATRRLLALGYEDVSVLEGGLAGYVRAGGEVYRDVNVPSKAFGELVEAISGTPSIPASEASAFLVSKQGNNDDEGREKEEDVVVLDARRFEEYNTMSVPRGRSCPGGELLYRVFEAAPSPRTTVVVNCAGRTRSIVGAQTLINAGVPNKVVALRDGTIGWTLAGLQLDGGRTERVPAPSRDAAARAREHARRWAEDVVGVRVVGAEKLRDILAESGDGRTTYLLDVRDPEEHRGRGPPRGFVSAPGGQLVQATDEWVGVRGARLVLYDTDGVRARMTGSWLVQLGWEVYVLDEREAGPELDIVLPSTVPAWRPPAGDPAAISAEDLKQKLPGGDDGVTVIDLARSPTYAKGHIPGSWFASGPELARDVTNAPINSTGPVVLTSPDGVVAAANAEQLRTAVPGRQVSYLAGGTAAWTAAGFGLETEEARWLSEPVDVYKRPYEGTSNAREAMRGYIEWEHGLVAQLANDGGIARFRVVRPREQSAS